MNFLFKKDELHHFQDNILKEWALTNGLGGYAGTSINGALNRTHQGYLIASLHPPVERYVVFSKTDEKIICGTQTFDFTTAQHKADDGTSIYANGQHYLSSFCYDGTISYTYETGNITLKKSLALVQGHNICAISYEIENKGDQATFVITPHMNFREHSCSSVKDSLQFTHKTGSNDKDFFCLYPKEKPDFPITLYFSQGTLVDRKQLFDENVQLQTEVNLETDGLDCHYTPYDIVINLPANATIHVSLICQAGNDNYLENMALLPHISDELSFDLIAHQKDYLNNLITQSGLTDDFGQTLTIAANQFLAYRQSTDLTTVLAGLPWFTDWGRDTMIAFTGLTLATRRFDEAREILLTFAKYVHHGMVPNMFPDDNAKPLYNTVDASLWYFYATWQYLKYDTSNDAKAFIQKEIYPVLETIILSYKKGTDFSIYMDDDYLLHAGSGLDQVTWMDVRVGDMVVTPRHGKPVEINALWYNALKIMEELSTTLNMTSAIDYHALADNVKTSFANAFWYEKGGYLYDVIDKDEKDASLRPNQIYAVSLPFSMLNKRQEKAIVDTVYEKLYVGCGLRSLSRDHDDYHPIYSGALAKRDLAYHQGTAWGFLLGGFISAYRKVYGDTKEGQEMIRKFYLPVKKHFQEGCIGSVSEIFDGDTPHTPRGCYAQAWSVGEILRSYIEDTYEGNV